MNRLSILIALSVVMLVVACAGQEPAERTQVGERKPGEIEGTVTGPHGEPVAGMRVGIVSGTEPFLEIAPETDEKGHYRLSSIAPGTYEVAVHDKQGRRVGLKSVGVKSGETATLDFSISKWLEWSVNRIALPTELAGIDTRKISVVKLQES